MIVAEWGESRVLFMPQEAGTERLTSEMRGISAAIMFELRAINDEMVRNKKTADIYNNGLSFSTLCISLL